MISYPQFWARVMGVFAAQRTRPCPDHRPDAPETEEVAGRAAERVSDKRHGHCKDRSAS